MSEERDDLTIGEMRTWGPDGPWPEEESGAAGGMEGGWDPSQTIGELPTVGPKEEGMELLAGRYRVVRRLGEGGMGSVWLAEDTKLDGRRVAVKMLPAVLAGKKGAYRRVKQEALMAMRLSHPNIATVRAFEEDEGGNPFLVMDYIEGEGLDEILEEKGELSEAETVRLLGPVAAALDYAHSQGVVHRDVKPGNVMVRKDGTPFVLDFGIAREIQETMTRVTGKFSSGTLLYMSPEQLHGRAPKAAQDVYSFAAMAYECLKGEPPFARGQIEYQIDHDAPEPLEEGVASKALREGILAGLAKEPEGRPGSCAGVLAKGGASQGGASTPCEPENGTAAGSVAGSAAGRTARPEGSPHQRSTVRPLPNTDAATAGRRDGSGDVFLRKVRVGRALEEAQREGATEAMMEKEAGESKKLEAGKRRDENEQKTKMRKRLLLWTLLCLMLTGVAGIIVWNRERQNNAFLSIPYNPDFLGLVRGHRIASCEIVGKDSIRGELKDIDLDTGQPQRFICHVPVTEALLQELTDQGISYSFLPPHTLF